MNLLKLKSQQTVGDRDDIGAVRMSLRLMGPDPDRPVHQTLGENDLFESYCTLHQVSLKPDGRITYNKKLKKVVRLVQMTPRMAVLVLALAVAVVEVREDGPSVSTPMAAAQVVSRAVFPEVSSPP